ncbi:MAG TPA: hypothetical protein VMY37_13930 [Thermoguttaceae bacterium]|nr:hypothetical protein [Thermoguttaceae bacterium]
MPYSRPQTVGELIDLLKLFPGHFPIEFQGLTLFQIKDRGEVASFEFNELFEITHDPNAVHDGD